MTSQKEQTGLQQALAERTGVWFLYDGDCPMCRSVAQAVRIRKRYGSLHLVDARQAQDDSLYLEVTRRGLSLDEGMVIYADERFFHGRDALTFVARFGDPINLVTILSKGLFRLKAVATLLYPMLRAARNGLLRARGVERIENLDRSSQPTFQPVFGDDWHRLPPVMRRHYANRPYSADVTVVEGTMDIACHGPIRWLAPVMNRMGQIPAMNDGGVAVRVEFRSDPSSRVFHFRRVFSFSNGRIYEFRSQMSQVDGPEMVEVMRFGLCWRFRCGWDGKKVVLAHRGYAVLVLGWRIPLPLGLLIGRSDAEEAAVDDVSFEMVTRIIHPWWGRVYEYKGRFAVVSTP